ncbi:MAG TPA: hypothetical protein VF382_03295 [Actinomycetota bacterium]
MKRVATVVFAVLAFTLLVVAPAFAGGAGSTLGPGDGPQVKGEIVRAGGTAFTGANISLGVLLMVALLLTGVALFAISRRRATASR